MAGRSSPINIATSTRNGSISPRTNQTSNLTSALSATSGNELRPASAMDIGSGNGKGMSYGKHDSSGFGSNYGSGAQAIPMNGANKERPRRESMASSMVQGMSWGGVSVSSWIRDDIIMGGNSPFAYPQRSPSFHSSSYLPKMEANFMTGFSCCGETIDSLHALLTHYEENHANESLPVPRQQSSQSNNPPNSRAAIAAGTAAAVQQQGSQQSPQPQESSTSSSQNNSQRASHQSLPSASGVPRHEQQHPHFRSGDFQRTQLETVQDMDAVEDMELDDMTEGGMNGLSNGFQQNQYQMQDRSPLPARSQFGQPPAAQPPPLDMSALNMGNPLQAHQGLRNSTPTTPVSGSRSGNMYQNNPTVSSVNTPTLSNHPLHQQQQYRKTPDSSAPGTPQELDSDFIGNVNGMSMGGPNLNSSQQFVPNSNAPFSAYGLGTGNDMLDLCIDEPAKRLFSPQGGYNGGTANGSTNSQQYASFRLGNAQYGANSEIARRIREQQMRAGLPDTMTSGLNGDEPKPFRCPVIGCEKAYKNQNGLKYHKSHGHNSQQLHENPDGTFSIVDPTTSTPYPGTLGMEKEKPYRCEVCGKRYKNLNGLKYHKSHSPPCDPDGTAAAAPLGAGRLAGAVGAPAGNVNVAGVGLPGIGNQGI